MVLTDSGGTPTQQNLYEGFGSTVAQSGTSTNNRLRNTKERDASIGLDNDGFRYYDPDTGRYIQRDPIGYGDGLNVYAHVTNNPVNQFDPLGLEGRGLQPSEFRSLSSRQAPSLLGTLLPHTARALGDPGVSEFHTQLRDNYTIPALELGAASGAVGAAAVASVAVEPLDWAMTANDIYEHPSSGWSYAGLLPFVPAAAGKAAKSISKVAKEVEEAAVATSRAVDAAQDGASAIGKLPEGTVYDVGMAKDLRSNPLKGTEVNHAPQSAHARSLIGDWNPANAVGHEPSIRLPVSEHDAVSAAQAARTRTPSSAREMLADEAKIIRNNTDAPNSAIKDLIKANKDTHPDAYRPLHRE